MVWERLMFGRFDDCVMCVDFIYAYLRLTRDKCWLSVSRWCNELGWRFSCHDDGLRILVVRKVAMAFEGSVDLSQMSICHKCRLVTNVEWSQMSNCHKCRHVTNVDLSQMSTFHKYRLVTDVTNWHVSITLLFVLKSPSFAWLSMFVTIWANVTKRPYFVTN